MKYLQLVCVALALVGLSACSKKQAAASDENHAGHDHAGHDHGSGHVHKALMGGELVELGEHQFNLELKYDAARGVLQAWILDAHAENFVRSAMASFDVQEADGAKRVIVLRPVGNALTGEAHGDTSAFEGEAPWLREVKHFDGVVKALRVRGVDFRDVKFHLHP